MRSDYLALSLFGPFETSIHIIISQIIQYILIFHFSIKGSDGIMGLKVLWSKDLCCACQICSLKIETVQFSHSLVSNSLRLHGLQHTRPPCPSSSPTPGSCSNSCPLSLRCHPTISSSVAPSPLPSIFPSFRVFSNESVLHIRWPKYWTFSFSITPSNEYSGLISFRR